MKNLLYKEFKLATHPTSFMFMLFGAMLMIPSYPYYVAFFYITLGTFFVFVNGRENKDVLYTVMLPIAKKDAVKARCLMLGTFQLITIVFAVPFAFLSVAVNPNEFGNEAGIEPNVAFFGFVFMFFSVFNMIMIPGFYKTAYKAGVPFIKASIGMIIFWLAAESLVFIPSPVKDYLDTTDFSTQLMQLPILAAGIIIWIVSFVLVYKKSSANFEQVDL